MVDIEIGLKDLVATMKRLDIRSIAVPPLGCGNGGLDWSEVRPRIDSAFAELPDVRVLIFVPGDVPVFDESEFIRMVERGTIAWADVPDASQWVEDLRGSTDEA